MFAIVGSVAIAGGCDCGRWIGEQSRSALRVGCSAVSIVRKVFGRGFEGFEMIIQSTSRAEGAVPIHAIVAAQAAVVWGRKAARIPHLDNEICFLC